MLLQEKRTIKTGKDAIELLNNGKLAGRLEGTTMSELEADWDDFLVNNLANYLGA